MRPVGKLVRNVLSRGRVAQSFAPLTRNTVPVFMLHRFADPETGVRGHSPEELRRLLAHLRRNQYDVISMGELPDRLAPDARPLYKTVAFTVDDGYANFARVAAPIFREYDCPVTVFLCTGFLDGVCWLWWDSVTLACSESPRQRAVLDLAGETVTLDLSDQPARSRTASEVNARLKTVPEAARLVALANLPAALEVDLPAAPPAKYAPMAWADVRAAAAHGVTFGAHTVTHPILTQTEDSQAEGEIRESVRRVRDETDAFVPIFCYPNGDAASFSDREVRLLRSMKLEAAVTTIYGYVHQADFLTAADQRRYTLPRVYGHTLAHRICIAAGVEQLWDRFSASRSGRHSA